jgi:hypothetical protein
MKFMKNIEKMALIVAICAVVFSFSSCNRGYGCPYDMKTVVKTAVKVIK